MKRFLLTFVLSLLFMPLAQAEESSDEAICAQVMTAAISPRGECEIYPTPCDVPGNWKALPASSCQDVNTSSRYRASMSEQRRARRGYGGGDKLRQRARSNKKRSYSRRRPQNSAAIKRRLGSSSIYQSNTQNSEDKSGFEGRRGRTTRNYRSRFANYGNRKVPGKDEISETAKKHRRGRTQAYRRLGRSIRKEANRDGDFSNNPRWNVETRNRRTIGKKGQNPYWANPRYQNRSKKSKPIIKVNEDGTLDEEGLEEYLRNRNTRKMYHNDLFRNASLDGQLDDE